MSLRAPAWLKRLRGAPSIAVSESRGLRSLHIGGAAIQSAMRIDDPFALALDYTRCMMGGLLLHPRPRQALLIGLGGGSLAKFFHRRLRRTQVRAVECDARVVEAARRHFELPPDDDRLTVEIGDGCAALAPEGCDLLMVDGFDDEEQAPGLVSQDFYDAAHFALSEPGLMVVNFMSDDRSLKRFLGRIEQAFGGAPVLLPALSDPNLIAFAPRGGPDRIAWTLLKSRATKLEARLGLPFVRMLRALRRANGGNGAELVVRG